MDKKEAKRFLEKEVERAKRQVELSIKMFGKEIKGKITLYHGTNEKNLKEILKKGLIPRGSKKSNWESGIGKSRKDLVYLTTCYACYYASNASSSKKNRPVVLKIEIDVDKFELFPDEEFIFRTIVGSGKVLSEKEAKKEYESIDPKEYTQLWNDSLRFMGTVTAKKIPVENIVGYAIGEGLEFLTNCDPTISPVNYMYCSGRYIEYLESLKYIKLR